MGPGMRIQDRQVTEGMRELDSSNPDRRGVGIYLFHNIGAKRLA
jgi:hypothetical protein